MRRLLATVFAVFTLASTSAATDIEGSFFAVIVSDVEIATAWYSSALGLEAGRPMSEPGRYEVVILSKPGLVVELLELDEAQSRPEGRIEGPFKVGMFVKDIDAFIATLPESISAPDVINDEKHSLLLIQLRDPDNNIIQVMQLLNSEADSQ